MTDTSKTLILEAGSGLDVDSNTGEGTRQRLGCDTDAIGKGGNTVELDRVLKRSDQYTGEVGRMSAHLLYRFHCRIASGSRDGQL